MDKRFEGLNSPFKIGNVTVKNRFVVAPMDVGYEFGPDGTYSKQGIDYYVRLAQGGFGLIYSGGHNTDIAGLDPYGLSAPIQTNPRGFIAKSAELLARTSAYGAQFFPQVTLGLGRCFAGFPAPKAMPVWGDPSSTSPVMSTDEVYQRIEGMVSAAALVRQAGFPGVDVHAIHWGHLMDQFAMAFTNDRTDEFGGSLENRLRIPRLIVEGIRKSCGDDFAVTIRLCIKSYMRDFNRASFDGSDEVGRDVDEAVQVARLLESYGYDGLSVDTGTMDSLYWAVPPSYVPRGCAIDLAGEVRKAVDIPVLLAGRMGDPLLDERAVEDGKVDAVVLGRPSFADPDFPRKVFSGSVDQIRPCIGCNQGCIHRYLSIGAPCGCAVNAEQGRDVDYLAQPAMQYKDVVVVGGGVAGMEAARVCALRGHGVTLFEKADRLGGNLIPAGQHSFKREILDLSDWYVRQLKELGVKVCLGMEATPESVLSLSPDAVVLAVGSVPVMPRGIPGIRHPKALSCLGALADESRVGRRVVVVGGGLVGAEMALQYAMDGKEVTIVEALPAILSASPGGVPVMNQTMLVDAFEHYGVSVRCGMRLAEITDEGAVAEPSEGGGRELIPADTVVVAIGFRPLPTMASELSEHGVDVYEVGDGAGVGNIMTCVWQAYEVARGI